MQLNKAIFYIKYYAKKHDCIIERKATLDDECFEGVHKSHLILLTSNVKRYNVLLCLTIKEKVKCT